MNDFTYHIPTKVHFGKHCLEKIGTESAVFGKKVLIVYGGGSVKKNGLLDSIKKELNQDQIVYEFGGVEPNPKIEHARKGIEICKREGIDLIIAVGGGSVIDEAKAICAGALVEHDVWDFFGGPREPVKDALPLITVVTIASTGSEMSCGAVLSNDETKEKTGRAGFPLFPKVTFLDPEYSFTVSQYQTACGTADILSHLIENYFRSDLRFDMLDRMMEGLMKCVIDNGRRVMADPCDYDARGNLLWAASWAMNGFFVGGSNQLWSCHPIEHEISAKTDLTHGLGLAVIMPKWLKYCFSDRTEDKYIEFSKNVFDSDSPLEGVSKLEEFLYSDLELSAHLDEKVVNADRVDEMAEQICLKGPINGFVQLSKEDVRVILLMCCEDK